MGHNALSKSMSSIPMWVMQTIVGVLLMAGVSWVTWATSTTTKHETRITVSEQKADAVQQDVKDIKEDQKEFRQETNRKLDRLLDRRGR